MLCDDGKKCVLKLWKCDGLDDCAVRTLNQYYYWQLHYDQQTYIFQDGSDEKNCTGLTCGPGEFSCQNGIKCIQVS